MTEREPALSAAKARSRLSPMRQADHLDVPFDISVGLDILEWLLSDDDQAPVPMRSELRECDFVDSDGVRSSGGEWVRSMLRPSSTPGIRVDYGAASGARAALVGIDGRAALVAAQQSPTSWGLSVIGSSAVPNVLMRFASIEAGPVIDETDRLITRQEFADAVSRTSTDEPDEQAGLVDAMLCAPWRRLTLSTTDGAALDIAQVPTWGLFELVPGDIGIELRSIASEEFHEFLIDLVAVSAGVEPADSDD